MECHATEAEETAVVCMVNYRVSKTTIFRSRFLDVGQKEGEGCHAGGTQLQWVELLNRDLAAIPQEVVQGRDVTLC